MKIVYATTNPGKFTEVNKLFLGLGFQIHAPREFGVAIEVEETGNTLEGNAILKAESYRDRLPPDSIILGDDTGVEIEALGGEPGIKVRRWKGYSMTDAEIIDYCLERLQNVPEGKRQAQFRTVIAVAYKGQKTQTFSGILPGRIVIEPHDFREEGLPFQPLFYATEYGKMIYEIHALPTDSKLAQNILTHRERAALAALPYLRQLIGPAANTPPG